MVALASVQVARLRGELPRLTWRAGGYARGARRSHFGELATRAQLECWWGEARISRSDEEPDMAYDIGPLDGGGETGARRLLALADYLETIPAQTYDHRTWRRSL